MLFTAEKGVFPFDTSILKTFIVKTLFWSLLLWHPLVLLLLHPLVKKKKQLSKLAKIEKVSSRHKSDHLKHKVSQRCSCRHVQKFW